MPFDMIKRTLLTGIGLALQTKDEIEEMAKDYVSKGELSENEGRKFLDDLTKRYDDAKEKFEEKLEGIVKRVIGKANIATKEEVSLLRNEIAELRTALKKAEEGDPQ